VSTAVPPPDEDLRAHLEAVAEWERDALSADRTRPRAASLSGPIAPCGCTSEDDRECRCWPVTSESGTVCLCLFHEPDEDAFAPPPPPARGTR
jgi:hypothetical protein